jgi:hypothetical protein
MFGHLSQPLDRVVVVDLDGELAIVSAASAAACAAFGGAPRNPRSSTAIGFDISP